MNLTSDAPLLTWAHETALCKLVLVLNQYALLRWLSLHPHEAVAGLMELDKPDQAAFLFLCRALTCSHT